MFEDIITVVKDMNGVEIKSGQTVLVHQTDLLEGIKIAIVEEVFPDNPTCNEPGFWVDIKDDIGVEGMMSYILEVKGGINNV